MQKMKPALWSLLMVMGVLLLANCRQPEPNPEPTPAETNTPVVAPTIAITLTPTTEPEPSPTFDTAVLENLPDWEPQLIYSSPVMGEEVMLDGAITLRFDQPMDPDSVAEALLIEPDVAGELSWPRPDTMIFTPAEQLGREQRYTVQIGEAAVAANGLSLREPINLQLQTVGFLEVSSLTPAEGTEIRRDDAVTVLFNRPVVPVVASQDQDQLLNPVVIEPEIEGKGEWISTSIYRFTPTDGWAGGTQYKVTVPQGLEDVSGGVLAEAVETSFSTENPYLATSYPWRGAEGLLLDAGFRLTFNMPMDRASTEAAVSLSREVPLTFSWDDFDQTLLITPTQPLEIGTSYLLDIDSSAQAQGGGATLQREERIDFQTVPLPAVVDTRPEDGRQDAYASNSVNFFFASPMNWETIVDQVEVSPESAGQAVTYEYEEGGAWLAVNFEQDHSSGYTVVIPATAEDIYGNQLGQAYILSFRTRRAEPYANFNLPYGVNHLSHSFSSDIGLFYRNVSELNVVLYDAGLPVELAQGFYYGAAEGSTELMSWTIDTSETAENENGVSFVSLNNNEPLPNGVYYVSLTTPEFEAQAYGGTDTYLVVADTNLVVKESVDGVYVWATDISSGRPVTATVLALYDGYRQQLGTAETDDDGFAHFDYTPPNGYFEGVAVIAETAGQPGFGFATSQWNDTVAPYEFGIDSGSSVEVAQTSYLYTDRPLYRPGDTVYFRGILREQNYGRYALPQNRTVQVAVESWSYSSNEPFREEFELAVTPDGTFDGEITLPEEAELGDYYISLLDPYELDRNGVGFQLLEFRKPEFEVMVTAENI